MYLIFLLGRSGAALTWGTSEIGLFSYFSMELRLSWRNLASHLVCEAKLNYGEVQLHLKISEQSPTLKVSRFKGALG